MNETFAQREALARQEGLRRMASGMDTMKKYWGNATRPISVAADGGRAYLNDDRLWRDLWSAWEGDNFEQSEMMLRTLSWKGTHLLKLFPILSYDDATTKYKWRQRGEVIITDTWEFGTGRLATKGKRTPGVLNRSVRSTHSQGMQHFGNGFSVPLNWMSDSKERDKYAMFVSQVQKNIRLTWAFQVVESMVREAQNFHDRRATNALGLRSNSTIKDRMHYRWDMIGALQKNGKGFTGMEDQVYQDCLTRNVTVDSVLTTAGTAHFLHATRHMTMNENGENVYPQKRRKLVDTEGAAYTPMHGMQVFESRKFPSPYGDDPTDPMVEQIFISQRFSMLPERGGVEVHDGYTSRSRHISVVDADIFQSVEITLQDALDNCGLFGDLNKVNSDSRVEDELMEQLDVTPDPSTGFYTAHDVFASAGLVERIVRDDRIMRVLSEYSDETLGSSNTSMFDGWNGERKDDVSLDGLLCGVASNDFYRSNKAAEFLSGSTNLFVGFNFGTDQFAAFKDILDHVEIRDVRHIAGGINHMSQWLDKFVPAWKKPMTHLLDEILPMHKDFDISLRVVVLPLASGSNDVGYWFEIQKDSRRDDKYVMTLSIFCPGDYEIPVVYDEEFNYGATRVKLVLCVLRVLALVPSYRQEKIRDGMIKIDVEDDMHRYLAMAFVASEHYNSNVNSRKPVSDLATLALSDHSNNCLSMLRGVVLLHKRLEQLLVIRGAMVGAGFDGKQIMEAMSNVFGTGGMEWNTVTQRMALLRNVDASQYRFWGTLIRRNVPLPIGFLLFRRRMRVDAGSVIFFKKGGETGVLCIKDCSVTFSRDVASFALNVGVRLTSNTVIVKPENLELVPHVFLKRYRDGGAVTFVQDSKNNANHDIHVVAVPYNHRCRQTYTDISGSLHESIAAGDDSGGGSFYATAEYYARRYGWKANQRALHSRRCDADNESGDVLSVCAQSSHFRYNASTQRCDLLVSGVCPMGPRADAHNWRSVLMGHGYTGDAFEGSRPSAVVIRST